MGVLQWGADSSGKKGYLLLLWWASCLLRYMNSMPQSMYLVPFAQDHASDENANAALSLVGDLAQKAPIYPSKSKKVRHEIRTKICVP